jgi:hypothetical protein
VGASSASGLRSGSHGSGGAGSALADLREAFLEAIRAHPVARCGRVSVRRSSLLGSRGDLPIAPGTYHHDNKEVVASRSAWHSTLKKNCEACELARMVRRIPWWSWAGSNRRPLECHSSALPTELQPRRVAQAIAGLPDCKECFTARSRRDGFSQTRGGAAPASWYVRPPARRSGGTGIRRALKMPRSLRPCGFESHLRHQHLVLAVVEWVSG